MYSSIDLVFAHTPVPLTNAGYAKGIHLSGCPSGAIPLKVPVQLMISPGLAQLVAGHA
jgi:hypothetical protein